MAYFLIDEDLSRRLAPTLRDLGLLAEDVREIGLTGATDDDVISYAMAHQRTLVTGDVALASHTGVSPTGASGMVLVRFPNELPSTFVNQQVGTALRYLGDQDIAGHVIVIEPGRIRTHRKL